MNNSGIMKGPYLYVGQGLEKGIRSCSDLFDKFNFHNIKVMG